MAEQLAFEQRLRQRPAVERDERGVAPRAVLVDRQRRKTLAGAGLALDQHRHVGGRQVADLLHDPGDRARPAGEGRDTQVLVEPPLHLRQARAQPLLREPPLQRRQQTRARDRARQDVVRPGGQRRLGQPLPGGVGR